MTRLVNIAPFPLSLIQLSLGVHSPSNYDMLSEHFGDKYGLSQAITDNGFRWMGRRANAGAVSGQTADAFMSCMTVRGCYQTKCHPYSAIRNVAQSDV
jgi:hypothetical protein